MSGGGIEREREGAWEQGREGNFKGGSIFTNQPFTNRPLPLRLGASGQFHVTMDMVKKNKTSFSGHFVFV